MPSGNQILEALSAGLGAGLGAAAAGLAVDGIYNGLIGDSSEVIIVSQFLLAGFAALLGVLFGFAVRK